MNIPVATPLVVGTAMSDNQRDILIRLRGDVDIAAEACLATVIDKIAQAQCANVDIDLADVTFAGSTLLHFVDQLCTRLPAAATVTLCHPSSLIQEMLELVRLIDMVVVRSRLPRTWTVVTTTTATSSDQATV
jgi:anti-anti-sigma factor